MLSSTIRNALKGRKWRTVCLETNTKFYLPTVPSAYSSFCLRLPLLTVTSAYGYLCLRLPLSTVTSAYIYLCLRFPLPTPFMYRKIKRKAKTNPVELRAFPWYKLYFIVGAIECYSAISLRVTALFHLAYHVPSPNFYNSKRVMGHLEACIL